MSIKPESFPLPAGRTLEALAGWAKVLVESLTRQRETGTFLRLPRYTVATLPNAANAGQGAMIYVTNETGGEVMAVCDGTNWRRQTDRAVVS